MKARRLITINEKLEVVRFYNELKNQKKQAKIDSLEPRPAHGTRADRKAWKEKVQAARKQLKRNLQQECAEKFPLVKNCQVCKWVVTARLEQWEELPETTRSRQSATTNEWRRKIGLSDKGRPLGGTYPVVLQKELDMLVSEMTMGSSTVSERREVVTADCIVPRFCFRHSLLLCLFAVVLLGFLDPDTVQGDNQILYAHIDT